jgi:hypothetical protein
MRRLTLAAALVLIAAPAALAQTGFNPGTVVGNVYESPTCLDVCGFGYSPPPSYGYSSYAPGYGDSSYASRYGHRKQAQSRPANRKQHAHQPAT